MILAKIMIINEQVSITFYGEFLAELNANLRSQSLINACSPTFDVFVMFLWCFSFVCLFVFVVCLFYPCP